MLNFLCNLLRRICNLDNNQGQLIGKVEILKTDNGVTITLDGDTSELKILDSSIHRREVFKFDGDNATLVLGGQGSAGSAGDLIIRESANGNERILLEGRGGGLYIRSDSGNDKITLNQSEFYMRNLLGHDAFNFNIDTSKLIIGNQQGEIHFEGSMGNLKIFHNIGGIKREVLKFNAQAAELELGAQGREGDLIVRDDQGKERVRIDGGTGDIRLSGADCAEEFDITEDENVEPGTILVIDSDKKLHPCHKPYDKKVVGVVSGANGTNPGLILDKNPSNNKRLPIALSGKVYCKVDAQYSSIEIGDLLTTSSTIGHAMKAEEISKSFGSVVGKALSPLKQGIGLIPILVTLQ